MKNSLSRLMTGDGSVGDSISQIKNGITPFYNALVGKQSYKKNSPNSQTEEKMFGYLMGKPQKNIVQISAYKPNGSEYDYYYKLKQEDEHLTSDEQFDKRNKNVSHSYILGNYGLFKTDGYKSYYDLWDIDVLGNSGTKPIVQIGTPLNIYNRVYGNEPDVEQLYNKKRED